jgi:hypothetical protein
MTRLEDMEHKSGRRENTKKDVGPDFRGDGICSPR